jgi:hypothetical protein
MACSSSLRFLNWISRGKPVGEVEKSSDVIWALIVDPPPFGYVGIEELDGEFEAQPPADDVALFFT